MPGVSLVNQSSERVGAGDLAEAKRLLDSVDYKRMNRATKRAYEFNRATLALIGGDAKESVAHATLAMAPACGAEGDRVMLRLDWTADKRVPDCLLAEQFEVRFGSKLARITKLGKMNEGWCALDVLVPKGAESAVVTVAVDHDVYEGPTAFAMPCP